MRKILVILVLIFFGNSVLAQAFSYQIESWKTHNAVPVYFVPRPEIPMLDLAVVFDAGSSRDGQQFGVASLTSALLSEGSGKFDADSIAKQFDAVGAQFSANTTQDMTVVSLRSMSQNQYVAPAINLFLSALVEPTFAEKSFNRVKYQILDGIRETEQSPDKMAANRFFQALYGDQPYGHPVEGTQDSVSKLVRQDAVNFYRHYYLRENAKIVLVGDLSRPAAEQLANKIDAALISGSKAENLALSVEQPGKNVFVSMPVSQNSIVYGEVGINRQNPHYFDLVVANSILGGGNSMISLLFNKVRNENGLAYSIYSYFSPLALRGPFFISLMTRSEAADQALAVTKEIVKNFLAVGPTTAQLNAAKKNILGAFPLLLATNQAIAQNVTNIAFYDLPLDYLTNYSQNIKAVSVGSAKSAFAETVKLDRMITVIAGRNITNEAKH